MTVPCSLADSSQRCGWVKTHPYITTRKRASDCRKRCAPPWPPLRGGSARRRWGRELCGCPKYVGLWQGSLPPPLRGTSLAEGGFSTRRGGFHICPEGLPLPQASAGGQWSPLQNKSSPCTFMQDELWLGRRGSNSRMRESKSRALPLGDDPL